MRKHNPHHLQIWIPHPCDPRCDEKLPTLQKRGSKMRIPTAWRALWYLVFFTILVLESVIYALDWGRRDVLRGLATAKGGRVGNWASNGNTHEVGGAQLPQGVHPITHLMRIAEKSFSTLLKGETHSLEAAAGQYREKRGRHPPPGFDAWYHYAVEQGAIVVEGFWDQIYHDLSAFWSIEPLLLRKQAHVFALKVSIREGQVEPWTKNAYAKLDFWADMLKTLASHPHVHLPDMDIPFNMNNGSAMLVPWEIIDTAQSLARPMMPDPVDVISEYSGLSDIDNLAANVPFDPEWVGSHLPPDSQKHPQPFWSLLRPACPPQSPARTTHVFDDIWNENGEAHEEHTAVALLPLELPEESLNGYIHNWTRATDACQQPNLQGLHDAFIKQGRKNITMKLFPLFGDSKLSMSNEVLVPGATDWNALAPISDSSSVSWDDRENGLFWRGPTTVSRDLAHNWQRSHRHRLVSMLNATHVEIAEASIHSGNESTVGVGYAKSFRLLPANEYHLKSQTWGQLAEWVNGWADVAFMNIECNRDDEEEVCAHLDEYFSTARPSPVEYDENFKYAVSIDGGSGNDQSDLIPNLNNGKVTLRASIYRQWYDSRLVPWLHFVPMDTTYVDLYGIMEYFLGTEVDETARKFSHAVGEVQKHEHHFNTPGSESKEALEQIEEVDGTKQHDSHNDWASSSQHLHGHDGQTDSNAHASEHSNRSLRKRDSVGHDTAARRVAEAGKDWAGKVIRREDMLIYVYRLLLEYARVIDDRRDRLGWTGDLVKD